jgi:hypothetical protein
VSRALTPGRNAIRNTEPNTPGPVPPCPPPRPTAGSRPGPPPRRRKDETITLGRGACGGLWGSHRPPQDVPRGAPVGVQGRFRGLFLWDPHTHHMQVRDPHSRVGVPQGCGGLWWGACGGPTTGNLVTVSHGRLVVPLVLSLVLSLVGPQVGRDFRTSEETSCAVHDKRQATGARGRGDRQKATAGYSHARAPVLGPGPDLAAVTKVRMKFAGRSSGARCSGLVTAPHTRHA